MTPPPAVPAITTVRLSGARDRDRLPLLVLGPSLGTSATTLWSAAAAHLADAFDVVAWDLPGHGYNRSLPDEPVSMADLAAGVLGAVDAVLEQRGRPGEAFAYAGCSVGGAVGLQLLLDAPDRVSSAVLLCTGASFGGPGPWRERAGQARTAGTASLVESSTARWFAPGYVDREPERAAALLQALRDADDEGYATVCGAVGGFDVRDRLAGVAAPVLAVAGACDVATPTDRLREVADGVPDGSLVVLDGVAHLAPAEAPAVVARLVRHCVLGEPLEAPAAADPGRTLQEVHDAGMAVRREVLGGEHVDRAVAATTDLTAQFQRLITTYAWGTIWTRPGLDRRSRSLITLTALVARGHHEELALHLRAARRNGLTLGEIEELLLQTAIYCGVPDANTAFRIAQQVLGDDATDEEDDQ